MKRKKKKTKMSEIVSTNVNRDVNQMQEWERQDAIEEETGLKGQWEDITVECPQCSSSDNVYLFCDNKTCYCLECSAEFDLKEAFDDLDGLELHPSDIEPSVSFDMTEDHALQAQLAAELISDDPAEVNHAIKILEMAKPDAKKATGKQIADNQTKNYKPVGFQGGYKGDYGTYENYKGNFGNQCYHRPQHIIAGEGWGVWAGKKIDVQDLAKDYDVVMNLTYTSIKDKHVIPIPELAKWEDHGNKFVEIQMDWADYGTINLPLGFWQDLVSYIKEKKLKLLVFCQGGHGRTGTALACLLMVALGYKPRQAIQWVRKNYCREAIETKGQELYVENLMPLPVEEVQVKALEAGSKIESN